MDTEPTPKTFKREVAVAGLVLHWGLVFWAVRSPEAMEMAKFMALYTYTIAGAAFGFDAWSKQIGGK